MTPSEKRPSSKRAGTKDAETTPEEADALAEELTGLSYEQARDALIDVVRRLESGAETLEESLALWERGEALAQRCESWLAGAQARLDARATSGEETED